MENKKQCPNSKMKSSIILTVPTSQNENNKSSFELNIHEKHVLTTHGRDNKQKLFDFISDKNKFCFKSHFDHKGTKAFLNGKEEAMKKIELDENIEENKIKSAIIENKNKIKKKMVKMKSEEFVLKNKKSNKDLLNTEVSNKKKKKMRNSKSNKFLTNFGKNQLINLKDIFNDINLDEIPTSETNIPKIKPKKRK